MAIISHSDSCGSGGDGRLDHKWRAQQPAADKRAADASLRVGFETKQYYAKNQNAAATQHLENWGVTANSTNRPRKHANTTQHNIS